MSLDLDTLKVTQCYPSYIFEEFSEALGQILYPIGLADNGHTAIVKDEENKIYAIDGCLLFYIADTLDEAKEILSRDKWLEFKRVVEID